MRKDRFDEQIDCDLENMVDEVKESVKIFAQDLKRSLKEMFVDLEEEFSELREGLKNIFESDVDSSSGREFYDYRGE